MLTSRDEQFHDFVMTERSGMIRTATLLTAGDGHLAEDLVQSTLTALYVAWPVFVRAGNRGGYVRRSLANALIDERRRPWRRRERLLPELPEQPAGEDPSADRTDALHRALRDLPPRMRAAVVFRYLHDLSVADTADALGCTQGTVKSQTARALDKLRDVLGPLDDVPEHGDSRVRPQSGRSASHPDESFAPEGPTSPARGRPHPAAMAHKPTTTMRSI